MRADVVSKIEFMNTEVVGIEVVGEVFLGAVVVDANIVVHSVVVEEKSALLLAQMLPHLMGKLLENNWHYCCHRCWHI